jgi:hypothetical protein
MPTAMRNRMSGHPVFLKNMFPRKPMESIAPTTEKTIGKSTIDKALPPFDSKVYLTF